MKNLLVLLACIMCLGCAKKQPQPKELIEEERLRPHTLIYLQPYEDFTKEETIKLIPKLQKEFDTWLNGAWDFKVLDPISLPEGCKVPVNKYVAVRILSKQNEHPLKNNELILGLTHKDLCANVHGTFNIQDKLCDSCKPK